MIRKAMWILLYIVAFILSFTLSVVVTIMWPSDFGGIGKAKWDDSVGKVYKDLPYADGEQNKFDLYVPADHSKDSYGLVLYIHAGGFTGGDKADDAMWAKYMVSKGYVAATINYTTNTKEHPSSVKQMSQEIRQGVAAIKKDAARRGFDLHGMAAAGGSAGGALAMIYAYRDYEDSPIPVKCVIEMVGPASFEPSAWFGFDGSYKSDEEAKSAAAFVTVLTGDNVTPEMMRSGEYKRNLESISAYALVTEKTVPTLAAYGPYDKVVPIGLSTYLFDAFKKHAVPYDYIEFPNSGHALNRDSEQADLLVRKIDEYLERYLPVN